MWGVFLQAGASGGAAQNAQAYAWGGSGLPGPMGRTFDAKARWRLFSRAEDCGGQHQNVAGLREREAPARPT